MHPYTKALSKAYPKKVNKSDNITLYSLRGNVIDDLENISKGCVFKERCDFAKELCFNKVPELFKFQGEHYSACFKSKGII
jgi:oligopeptide/dipeptide ABC transporter ATP-binding protein